MIITITIEIEDCGENIPDSDRYLASIKDGSYKNTTVTAGSIAECIKELSISIDVFEQYNKVNT